MSNLVTCSICQNGEVPHQLAEDHHKVPRACGGSDDPSNRCWLHAGCHNNVHRWADLIRSGKNSEAADMAKLVYNSVGAQKRALELSQIVARSFEIPDQKREWVQVVIKVPSPVYAALRVMADERRRRGKTFGNRNSKTRGVAVSKLLIGLATEALRKRGYLQGAVRTHT